MIRALITRAKVDRSPAAGNLYQLAWLGGRVTPDVEHMQPQGLHFRAPGAAQGALLAPSADPSVAVVVGLGGALPPDDLVEGEGGLHYLGEWRVFVDADGKVHLGARDPSDFVALASKVDQAINDLNTAISAGFDAVGAAMAADGALGKAAFEGLAPTPDVGSRTPRTWAGGGRTSWPTYPGTCSAPACGPSRGAECPRPWSWPRPWSRRPWPAGWRTACTCRWR